jgi:hypothetical protein
LPYGAAVFALGPEHRDLTNDKEYDIRNKEKCKGEGNIL